MQRTGTANAPVGTASLRTPAKWFAAEEDLWTFQFLQHRQEHPRIFDDHGKARLYPQECQKDAHQMLVSLHFCSVKKAAP
jgi:hypothetical protein